MKPSRSTVSKAFRAAVFDGDVARAKHLWETAAHSYPSVLPMAWACLTGSSALSESPMEGFLRDCSTAKSTPAQWRSRAGCEALFRVQALDSSAWSRRWKWAHLHVCWKTADHKALAVQLAYGSEGRSSLSSGEFAEEYRSRLKDVLSQSPYLPGLVWGVLGASETTRDLALELPAAAHTTPEFRGGLVAMACLASPLSSVSEPWLQAFVNQGMSVATTIHIDVNVDHVSEERQGAHRLACLLDMEATDLYQLSRFSRTDAYEDAFPNDDGWLRVDRVWGRSKATAGEDPEALASQFKASVLGGTLKGPGAVPTRKPRM